jgi:hypothetical protein
MAMTNKIHTTTRKPKFRHRNVVKQGPKNSYIFTYMGTVGCLQGYVYCDTAAHAAALALNLIADHDPDYDTQEVGGCAGDGSPTAFVMGKHWCLQIVDKAWQDAQLKNSSAIN